jgi:hypothetical protein
VDGLYTVLVADDGRPEEEMAEAVSAMTVEDLARSWPRPSSSALRYALMLSSQGEWWAVRGQTGLEERSPEAFKMTGCRRLTDQEAFRIRMEPGELMYLDYEETADRFFEVMAQLLASGHRQPFQIQLGGWL